MKLSARLQAVVQTVHRNRERPPVASVCDRIEELTALFAEHPPMFSPAIEAGILAVVEREERALAAT